jgi:pSer/pThr/pTyr-binding forkhead associated (FHA) protein
MNKILIRHLTGSRANQVDQFPGAANEIVFGREPGVTVQYDENRDDLVSRQHVKIIVDGSGNCQISDLQSRNGAFLNQQRLFGSARLSHNDVVQLGAGGPEFRFEIDPPPATAKPTRMVATGAPVATAMTRESAVGVSVQSSHRPIGHATVERMLDANYSKVKKDSNKFLVLGLIAAGIVLVAGIFFYLRLSKGTAQNQELVQQQQQVLQQMDQQIQQEPVQTNAMREQITQLSAELKKSEQRNERNLQAITKALAASNGQPPATASTGLTFEQQVKMVLDSVKTNPTQAMKGAAGLISQYPNRWESYLVAGVVLRSQNQLPQARLAYQRALGLAPDNVKPQLAAAIQQIDAQSGAASK